jgi:hypothetical protein
MKNVIKAVEISRPLLWLNTSMPLLWGLLATLRYGCGALALAWIARAVGGPHAVVSVNVLDNFILVLFLTLLIAPAGFLAQRLLADEEAPAR